jgi:hypothetical protein
MSSGIFRRDTLEPIYGATLEGDGAGVRPVPITAETLGGGEKPAPVTVDDVRPDLERGRRLRLVGGERR